MRNLLMACVVCAMIVMIGCEKKPPIVNGKTVLNLEQYNQLMAAMTEKQVEQAKNNDTDNATSNFAQGAKLLESGKYVEAATAFQAAVTEDPNNSRAWYMLGNCREKSGELASAQEAYKKSYDLMVKQGYIPDSSMIK